ncbi:MAG: hypothetical protein ABIG44_10050 [Planctomycetota bacterium]
MQYSHTQNMNAFQILAKSLLLTVAGMLVVPANGQLRLFLAPTGVDELSPLNQSPALENAAVQSGELLYIYAQMSSGPESWNGISLDIEVRGGGTIADWQSYDYVNDTFVRWDYVGQGSLEDEDTLLSNIFGLAYLDGFGVQNDPVFDDLDLHYRHDVDATLLGWVQVTLPEGVYVSEVFLGIGGYGIIKAGTSVPQDIYLGFGDEDDGLSGNDVHQFSTLAEAAVGHECNEFVLGDANCDRAVSAYDIDAFILAMSGEDNYAEQYPDCHRICTCDLNLDGEVNSYDIDAFIACIAAGGCE